MVIKKATSTSTDTVYSPMLRGCPACGHQISHKARICPHCGHPVRISELRALVICLLLAFYAPQIITAICALAARLLDK